MLSSLAESLCDFGMIDFGRGVEEAICPLFQAANEARVVSFRKTITKRMDGERALEEHLGLRQERAVGVVLGRVRDRLQMMRVAFLLSTPDALVGGKAIADENAIVGVAEYIQDDIATPGLVDAVVGELGVGEDPEPVPRSANPPTRFVRMHRGALADHRYQLVVRWRQPSREPGLQVDEPPRGELQGEVLVQHRARLGGGNAETLVQIGRERGDARSHLGTCRPRCQRHLSRMRRAYGPAVRARPAIRNNLRDRGPNRRNILDRLLDRPHIDYAPSAVRTARQRRLDSLINLLRYRSS